MHQAINPDKKKKINMKEEAVLESDYKKTKTKVIAAVHKVIQLLNTPINPKDLSYKHFKESSMKECEDLEREWFPSGPLTEYYKEALKGGSCFAICCYWQPKDQEQEYVIGSILVWVKKDNEAIKYLKDNTFVPNQDKLEQKVNLKNNKKKVVAHICSIGVIDEARRLGIGTNLIEFASQYAIANYDNCVGVTLNVISTGVRAIGLYEKCNFVRLFTVPNYYPIDNEYFDAYRYAKAFRRSEEDISGSSKEINKCN